MVRMLILTAAAAFASLGSWHYGTTHDPLGQTVHVAEIVPDASQPYVALRLMCGGVTGIVLQVNLGEMPSGSLNNPNAVGLYFTVADAPAYDVQAAMAPITDGVGTYEIKGSEAGNVAHLLMRGDQVTVRQGETSATFSLSGAALAIGDVIANCPFKV